MQILLQALQICSARKASNFARAHSNGIICAGVFVCGPCIFPGISSTSLRPQPCYWRCLRPGLSLQLLQSKSSQGGAPTVTIHIMASSLKVKLQDFCHHKMVEGPLPLTDLCCCDIESHVIGQGSVSEQSFSVVIRLAGGNCLGVKL